MINQAILNKALSLIEEAKTNKEFSRVYENNLRATGENAEAYSLYEIELSEDYYLVLDFVLTQLEDVSLVSRGHETHISYNAEED